jgi:hypothetical protein
MSHLFEHFPREIDMKSRKVVTTMKQLERWVKRANGKADLTTTVYGFRELKPKGNRGEYSTAIVDKFVVDLDKGRAAELDIEDSETGQRCTEDTLRLASHLRDMDIRHAVFFSGGGYHVWVMLDKVYELPPNELSNLLFSGRMLINKWVRDMDLITIDPVVSFRPDRHIRIPNTYNYKRKLWSIPCSIADLESGWNHITKKASKSRNGMIVTGTKGLEIEIVEDDGFSGLSGVFQKFDAEDVSIQGGDVQGLPILPCLEAACCTKGSNPPHQSRAYLMMFLMDYFRKFARPPRESKISNAEVITKSHQFIANLEWADYNPKITQEMLVHGASRYYITPSCPKIYQEGLCLGRCPFWDGKGA